MVEARYVHTNLVARDFRRLARFYQEAFGCAPLLPERDLAGEWLERATGLVGARIRGIHLRLPGDGDDGPTLEIFEYAEPLAGHHAAANRPGFGHIAFGVRDVAAAREAVRAAGGGCLGEVVTTQVAGAGTVTFAYLLDPEDNVVEVQSWG